VKKLFKRWVVLAITIGLVAGLMPGIHIDGGAVTVLEIALVFGLINLIIKPIVKLLSLPLIVLTIGLFTLVINAALFALVAAFSDSLSIDGIVPLFVGSLLIAIVSSVLDWILGAD
jgi:putative membrane protein